MPLGLGPRNYFTKMLFLCVHPVILWKRNSQIYQPFLRWIFKQGLEFDFPVFFFSRLVDRQGALNLLKAQPVWLNFITSIHESVSQAAHFSTTLAPSSAEMTNPSIKFPER